MAISANLASSFCCAQVRPVCVCGGRRCTRVRAAAGGSGGGQQWGLEPALSSNSLIQLMPLYRFVPYASVVAANTPEYAQQLADLSVGAVRNPNGTFVAPSASAPFPFASSALPQSIVSAQWASLNASASSEPLQDHTTYCQLLCCLHGRRVQ